nr:hypothetical protein [Tanacetum cinerariifolium]
MSISYPVNDTSSIVNHNAYMASSSAPQIDYALMVHHSSEYSPPKTGLVVLVFQKGEDPIDAINHMMSLFTAVVTSKYPATNNQLRNSCNPRQQATINNGREKVLVITAMKEQLHKLKGKAVLTEAVSLNPIDPELLKVDIAPLVPKLRKNRTAHTDYIRHTLDEAATFREILERVILVSSASGSMSQDNTKKNRIQRTQRKAKKNKVEDYLRTVKSSLIKKSVVDSKATSY